MSDQGFTVALTEDEVRFAALVGMGRQVQNLFLGRRDAHGADKDRGWQIHIEGAAAEMAFAKFRNRFWSGNLGNLRAADVGEVQVRSTGHAGGSLILHDSDPDDDAFVLVTGRCPAFVVRGWLWGREGKSVEFRRDPVGGRPAYFVPQHMLRPMVSRQRAVA